MSTGGFRAVMALFFIVVWPDWKIIMMDCELLSLSDSLALMSPARLWSGVSVPGVCVFTDVKQDWRKAARQPPLTHTQSYFCGTLQLLHSYWHLDIFCFSFCFRKQLFSHFSIWCFIFFPQRKTVAWRLFFHTAPVRRVWRNLLIFLY